MTLQLDPRLPLVWRTPDSLQVGVDDPPVVLTGVTTAHERMLAALGLGLTRQGLILIGTESGLTVEDVATFEEAIRPALAADKAVDAARVDIDGAGPTADRLERRLREAGLEPRRTRSRADGDESESPAEAADFAVIIGDYVLDPERRGRWLRRDIPHLPIVFGDTSVTVGPFIEPGIGPCLYCLELHRRDADPAWPALASQLLGRTSTAQSPFFASETAALATRMVLRRRRNGSEGSATSVTLDADTGRSRTALRQPHPDCACTGLTAVAAQAPQETGTARSAPAADRAKRTTTNGAARVPA